MPSLVDSPLRVVDYGTIDHRVDVVLSCPHGDDGKEFLYEFGQVKELCPSGSEVFDLYLALETDQMSCELMHSIARRLVDLSGGCLGVRCIEVLFPRGIVDANRVNKMCLRKVIDFEKYVALAHQLKRMHEVATEGIKTELLGLREGGVFLDVHTMAPFCPAGQERTKCQNVKVSPDCLDDYIAAYTKEEFRGRRRPINLLTRAPGRKTAAHAPLVKAVEKAFKGFHTVTRRNVPDPIGPHYMSSEYMALVNGLAIDVPKDLLSEHHALHPEWDLISPVMDRQKIREVAGLVASGVWGYLKDE